MLHSAENKKIMQKDHEFMMHTVGQKRDCEDALLQVLM